ncbi:hypothetical protein GJ496_002046 [Pomphorhynchus laevis]|nr:hypothetical protein GJ496_002046 [Pomphorhynchus laevis]
MQPVDIIISAIKSTSVWTVIATIFIGLCIIVWLYHQFCSWISIQQDSFPITIEVEGSNGVYCNPMLGPEGTLLPFQLKDVNSMYDAFFHGRHFAKLAGDERMLGKQQNEKYVWLTHDMVLSRIKQISSGILKFGLTPGQDTRVGIFAVNCVEWMLTALSCIFQNIVIVPINRYLDDNGIIHIINQCEIEMVFVKTKLEIERIIMLKDKCPTLCTIVSFEKFDFNRLSLSKDNAVETIHLCNLADIERKGLEYTVPFNPKWHATESHRRPPTFFHRNRSVQLVEQKPRYTPVVPNQINATQYGDIEIGFSEFILLREPIARNSSSRNAHTRDFTHGQILLLRHIPAIPRNRRSTLSRGSTIWPSTRPPSVFTNGALFGGLPNKFGQHLVSG